MGKPSKKEKYSTAYCWIRWTYLYPVPRPGPGPGRKRRRSLAGGLVWVLLGLVWLGSPFIVRLAQCSTDIMNKNEYDNNNNPIKQPLNQRSYNHYHQPDTIKTDITVTYNQRKTRKLQQQQRLSRNNQHYHHHHLHHPIQLINSNDFKSNRYSMESGKEVIEKKSSKTTCLNCIAETKGAEVQSKSNKISTRFQSQKFVPTLRPISGDSLRLEAIKQQILSKLGLKAKPNITHEFSKQTILNTLSRADDMNWQNDDFEPNSRNYYDLKFIDRHLFDSNSINTNNNIINHYDLVTSKNHITNNMNATFTKNHIIDDNDRINTNNKNLMDSKNNINNINNNQQDHITQKHHNTYHPSKSKNHLCSQPDKHKSSASTIPLNHNNHKIKIPYSSHKMQRNRTTNSERNDINKIKNSSNISDHSDNNLLFVNEDDSYQIDEQLLHRHELDQQPDQLNQPPNNNMDAEQDDYFGRTREVITFAEQGYLLNGQRLIEFSTNEDRVSGRDLRVRAAVLWIKIELRSNYRKFRRKNVDTSPDRSLTLWVFRVMESYVPSNSTILADKEFDRRTELIKSKSLDLLKLGWQKFDITQTVRKWYAEGDKKCLRLLVDCSGCGDRVDLHLFNSYDRSQPAYQHGQHGKHTSNSKNINYILNVPTRSTNEKNNSPTTFKQRARQSNKEHATPNRPFLVVFIDPNIMKRVRRRAFDCSGAPAGQCCKQKFYVNFRELGWDDWIIAPHGYYANYCKGDCSGPRTPDKFQSYHSHVIEEYRKIDRLSGIQPCCAPIKFSSMSLIYYEENKKIVKRDLPKMIVEECGCP